jgi:hypothetical protein
VKPLTERDQLGICCCRHAGLLSFRAGGVPSGPAAIWSYFIGRERIDYALYLNCGLSQPR